METTAATVSAAVDVRGRRRALGISRTALAVYAGCSVTHLQNIEAGVIPHTGEVMPRVLAALDAWQHGRTFYLTTVSVTGPERVSVTYTMT